MQAFGPSTHRFLQGSTGSSLRIKTRSSAHHRPIFSQAAATKPKPSTLERETKQAVGRDRLPEPPSSSSKRLQYAERLAKSYDQDTSAASSRSSTRAVPSSCEDTSNEQQKDERFVAPAWLAKLGISPRVRGLVLLNLLVLLMASNWVVVKESGQQYDPFAFATMRFSVAALAFLPFLRKALKRREVVVAGVELGVWSALGYFTQSMGLVTTEASRASFISTFTVIVVPLLAGMMGRGVRPMVWASAVAALVGVGLLENSGAAPTFGDAWSLVSAALFGIQIYRTEILSRSMPEKSSFPLMSVMISTIAVLSAAFAAAHSPEQAAKLLQNPALIPHSLLAHTFPWLAVCYTGFLSTDVALWIEVVALNDVSSTEAAVIYTMEPVIGAALAYVMLGERWGAAGWAGAGLIVVSSLVTQILGAGNSDSADGSSPDDTVEAAVAHKVEAEAAKILSTADDGFGQAAEGKKLD